MTAVQHQVRVRCSRDRAFRLFTRKVDAWWPGGHRTLGDSTMSLEPEGLLVERRGDEERVWGQVLTWQEPELLELSWCMGGPPTHVRITFTEDEQGTLVVVDHRPGPTGAESWPPTSARYRAGWTALFAALEEHLTQES